MSKTSSKKRYTQLVSWLETFKSSPKFKNPKKRGKSSRMKYYAKKGIQIQIKERKIVLCRVKYHKLWERL